MKTLTILDSKLNWILKKNNSHVESFSENKDFENKTDSKFKSSRISTKTLKHIFELFLTEPMHVLKFHSIFLKMNLPDLPRSSATLERL